MQPIHTEHPAYIASQNSIRHVVSKNKEAWLDLFAEDAVVEDPLGVSPLDPSGKGHHGRAGISAFWDMAIAAGDIRFELLQSHPCGDSCANVAHLTKSFSPEMKIEIDLVIVYRVNAASKVVSLKAYWEYDRVAKQLGG